MLSSYRDEVDRLIEMLKNTTISLLFPRKINWIKYRLGDMVKSLELRSRHNGERLHLERYPTSIASKYIRRTDTESNYDVLMRIVDAYRLKACPNAHELVVHLRVGEVIEKSKFSVSQLLEKQRAYHNPHQTCYVRPLSFYQDVIEESTGKYLNVTLVTGGCLARTFEESRCYIETIKSLFEGHGFIVSIRMGHPPDDDFVYMCRARHFVPSGGGFSRLIKGIVERKRGTIINPSQ